MSNFISYPQKNLTTFCLLIRVCAHICGTLMHLAILYIYIYMVCLLQIELVEYCIDVWKLSAYEVMNIGLHLSNLVLEESNFCYCTVDDFGPLWPACLSREVCFTNCLGMQPTMKLWRTLKKLC